MKKDEALLDFIVKELVDHPEDVKIERQVDEMGVLLRLSVNPEDMGKIIGKSGNTAKAIRTLLRIIGMKDNARVNLKIEEPEGSEKAERQATESAEEQAADEDASDVTDAMNEVVEDLKED